MDRSKRLKVIGLWALLLVIVTNGSAVLLVMTLGTMTGLLLTLVVSVLFAGFAGYQAARGLVGSSGYNEKNQLTIVGVSVAFLAAIITTGLNYLLTHKVSYSSGLLTIVSAAIGGYLVERKYTSEGKR